MRFKTDENIHPDAAGLLRSKSHDAVTVWDQGLQGIGDPALAAVCRREERVLVSMDQDFADIRTYPPQETPGIVVLRLASQGRVNLLSVLERISPFLNETNVRGKLWVVDESSVRVHGAD